MDLPSQLAAAAIGIVAGATLSETTDPLVRTIGGWAGLGTAVMCVVEAGREDPRWDRAAGTGAAWGALAGSLVVLHDVVSA
ncbi:MAG TPA: hypothetical protein VEW67_02700 [Thermoleophilaceae bacterium]|nr:hypothetical protein [Thermoleophilaceae bacterium]